MYFLNLPIDVGVIIFNYLDTKSKISAYNSCYAIRNFFAACNVKKVVLSRSTIATVKFLREDLFRDLGQHIQDLTLSGVPNLTAPTLKPHIDKFVQLKTLDVTFTNIYLSDLEEICPNGLKNLSINFFKNPLKCREDGLWERCKTIFKEKIFHYVHFVMFELFHSEIPLAFLADLPLTKDLKITMADFYKGFWRSENDDDDDVGRLEESLMTFEKLTYMFRDCSVTHKTSVFLKGVSNLDFNKLEYIFMMYLEEIVIYISPVFKDMFIMNCCDLRIEVSSYLPLDFMLDGNIIFKAWNKDTTTFDNDFFKNVQTELKDYFPTYVCTDQKIKMKVINAPSSWYCIDACDGFNHTFEHLPNKIILTDFCRKNGAITQTKINPITLGPTLNALKHVTFLRITDIFIEKDFLEILFSACLHLETLDIHDGKNKLLGMFCSYKHSLTKFIQKAKRLKNFKLTSENIEYGIVFEMLSHCTTLENIHICEFEKSTDNSYFEMDNVLLFIQNCKNLYSLFIEADRSPEALTLMMSCLRDTAQKCDKDHLCIEVCDCFCGWNPYVDVFSPSPLHIQE